MGRSRSTTLKQQGRLQLEAYLVGTPYELDSILPLPKAVLNLLLSIRAKEVMGS